MCKGKGIPQGIPQGIAKSKGESKGESKGKGIKQEEINQGTKHWGRWDWPEPLLIRNDGRPVWVCLWSWWGRCGAKVSHLQSEHAQPACSPRLDCIQHLLVACLVWSEALWSWRASLHLHDIHGAWIIPLCCGLQVRRVCCTLFDECSAFSLVSTH